MCLRRQDQTCIPVGCVPNSLTVAHSRCASVLNAEHFICTSVRIAYSPEPNRVMSFLNQSPATRAPIPVAILFLIVGCGEGSSVDESVSFVEVADVGLQGPRAIVYDAIADVYLVSNVNGGPLDEDENGFVSRISPEGEVLSAQWIPSVGSGDVMNGPKGMAIRGDSLFITDIGCIHIANRESGEIVETRCLDDVTSLSGIDVATEGSLFVTDRGFDLVDGQTVSSATDAVYRLTFREDQRGSTLAQGVDLNHPTGLAIGPIGILVTTAGGELIRFTPSGERTDLVATAGQVFEGVVFVADGGFAYSSSSDSSVYLVDGSGSVGTLIDGIGVPGDLGYDSSRNRVLIPLSEENRLLFVPLGDEETEISSGGP